ERRHLAQEGDDMVRLDHLLDEGEVAVGVRVGVGDEELDRMPVQAAVVVDPLDDQLVAGDAGADRGAGRTAALTDAADADGGEVRRAGVRTAAARRGGHRRGRYGPGALRGGTWGWGAARRPGPGGRGRRRPIG